MSIPMLTSLIRNSSQNMTPVPVMTAMMISSLALMMLMTNSKDGGAKLIQPNGDVNDDPIIGSSNDVNTNNPGVSDAFRIDANYFGTSKDSGDELMQFIISTDDVNDINSNLSDGFKICANKFGTCEDGGAGSIQPIFDKENEKGFTLNKENKEKKYRTINATTIKLIQDNISNNDSIDKGRIDNSHHRFIYSSNIMEKDNVRGKSLIMMEEGDSTKDKSYKFVDFLIRDDVQDNGGLWKFTVSIGYNRIKRPETYEGPAGSLVQQMKLRSFHLIQ